MKEVRELILSGCGTNFTALLGALDVFFTSHDMSHVERFIGTSMGSILCFFFCIGYTPSTVYQVARQYPFTSLHEVNASDLLSFFDNLGLMTGNKIIHVIHTFMKHKNISLDITFEQLHRYSQKQLCVISYCIHDQTSIEFSSDTFPSMPILTSIQMSISIPILFRPVLYNDKYYVDGGIYDILPIRFCKEKEKAFACMLVFNLEVTRTSSIDILQYIQLLMKGIFSRFTQINVSESAFPVSHILYVKIPYQPIMNYDMQLEIKEQLFESGKKQALDFLSSQGEEHGR